MPDRQCSLVISRDESLCTRLQERLGQVGLRVTACDSADEGLRRAAEVGPVLVILDLDLPDTASLDICRSFAAPASRRMMVLVSEPRRLEGLMSLELGADDFMHKPFDDLELIARARALLRRLPSRPEPVSAEVDLNISLHRIHPLAYLAGRPIRLRPRAHRLLGCLLEHVGDVCTKEELQMATWGPAGASPRNLAPEISYLRHVIESDPRHPRHLLTVRGTGYVLQNATDSGRRQTAETVSAP